MWLRASAVLWLPGDEPPGGGPGGRDCLKTGVTAEGTLRVSFLACVGEVKVLAIDLP